LGAPARIALLAGALVGVTLLGGCNSLSAPSAAGSTATGPGEDASGIGTGGDASAVGTSCHPGNVETFVPGAYRHATPAGQGACVSEDGGADPIQAYYDACIGPSMSKGACDVFAVSDPACAACIVSSESATAYGPLVLANGFLQANVAGCVEVEDPSNLSCAQAQQALSDCELAACSANCPVTDQTSLVAYEQCAGQADAVGCQAYYLAAECLLAEVEAGVPANSESACLPSTFEKFYAAIVPLFCGQASADASGSPAVDASGDAGISADAAAADASAADGGAAASADAGDAM
jgi:hypothetical protein